MIAWAIIGVWIVLGSLVLLVVMGARKLEEARPHHPNDELEAGSVGRVVAHGTGKA